MPIETAERHRVPRTQFIERIASVADVEIEEMVDFEVTYAELKGFATLEGGQAR